MLALRTMKPVYFGKGLPVFAALYVAASSFGIAQAQPPPARMTLLSPTILTMQTPIGEAHMEIPSGSVIENGTLANGGILIEQGAFTGWVPLESTNLPASKNKVLEEKPSPTPTSTPSPTAVPILEPVKPYEQPENSLIAFIVLLCTAILIALYATTSTQKWIPRIFRK